MLKEASTLVECPMVLASLTRRFLFIIHGRSHNVLVREKPVNPIPGESLGIRPGLPFK